MHEVGYIFRFPADQGDADFFADSRQARGAPDRRDFTDRDLTGVVSKKAWMCSKPPIVAAGLFAVGLLTAGLGRERMRDLRGLLKLIDQIPRQQLLDAIDRMVGDPLEDIVQVALRVDVI